MILIVIDVLGTVTKRLVNELDDLDIYKRMSGDHLNYWII